jgi:pyruvate dehydrogenase E2 component (dihydrolipoamide acetyltransferase)
LIDLGGAVEEREPICEIETSKAQVQVEAPAAGILLRRIETGIIVPVGAPIAVIGQAGEDASAVTLYPASGEPPEEHQELLALAAEGEARPSHGAGRSERILASPVAKRLAEELGVDLSQVHGTGPRGRISREDVETAARGMAQVVEPRPASEQPSKMRQAIAAAMTASAATPQFAIERDVDVKLLQERIAHLAAAHPGRDRPTIADAIAVATARALARHPLYLQSWSDAGYVRHERVNLGLAVAIDEGLIVPVVANANLLSVTEMALRRRGLQDRARAGRLDMAEISGGVFTISNLGPLGVDRFRPLVNPPESGILGIGRIIDRDGGSYLTLTLVSDHRVVDGANAARLLVEIVETLDGSAGLDAFLSNKMSMGLDHKR